MATIILPVAQKECPHAYACLSCGFFRTNASFLLEHKQQLIRTEEILVTARAKGWARQVEMNEKVKGNLEAIIASLEPQEGADGAA